MRSLAVGLLIYGLLIVAWSIDAYLSGNTPTEPCRAWFGGPCVDQD